MPTLTQLTSSKYYKTKDNAIKAVESRFPDATFRYLITHDVHMGFYPICIGDDALKAGTHFHFVTVS